MVPVKDEQLVETLASQEASQIKPFQVVNQVTYPEVIEKILLAQPLNPLVKLEFHVKRN